MSELIIDESNFTQYFRDCRRHKPERGDVIACYSAVAEFIDGRMKKDVIDLLQNKDKVIAATQVLSKMGCATEIDAVKVCKAICKDLASGMSVEEVEKKPYKYNMQMYYYTKKEYIPIDPHWTAVGIDLDEFIDAAGQKIKITTTVLGSDYGRNLQHTSKIIVPKEGSK